MDLLTESFTESSLESLRRVLLEVCRKSAEVLTETSRRLHGEFTEVLAEGLRKILLNLTEFIMSNDTLDGSPNDHDLENNHLLESYISLYREE